MRGGGAALMRETFEIAEGYESLLSTHGLGSLAAVWECRLGQRLDKPGLEGWRQRWRLRLGDNQGQERTLYLKRFEHPPLRRQIARWRGSCWGLSSAGVEWHNARRLAEAGVAAARPVAYGQQMRGPWEVRSFILLAEVGGASLERWAAAHMPPSDREPDARRPRELCDQLARFAARFHRAGFVHRDLYLSHVFIEPAGSSSTGGGAGAGEPFCLIDLQRVFRPRWRHRRWVVKDLAQLNYSTPASRVGQCERLRFLCRYVRECDRFGSARRLARLIGVKTARMIRRRPPEDSPAGVGLSVAHAEAADN